MKKYKYTAEDIVALFAAITAFLLLNPYFCWSTYNLWKSDISITSFLSIIFILTVIFISRKVYPANLTYCSIFAILIIALMVALGRGIVNNFIVIGRFIPYLSILALLLLSKRICTKAFNMFWLLFALSLIPALIVYILHCFDLQLPYSFLESTNQAKTSANLVYKNYVGCVFLTNTYNKSMFRFCGMFDEPGVVGTFGALLLIATGFNENRCWKNIIIFICGLLSLSVAFYISIFLYFFIENIKKRNRKSIVILLLILLFFITFMSVRFQNPVINAFQQRFAIVNGKLAGDNRTSSSFDTEFINFIKSQNVFWGYGTGSTVTKNLAGYSYKFLIYCYGFIGFALMIGWIIYTFKQYTKKVKNGDRHKEILLLFIFILNIYQRPYVFNLAYMLILFGGGLYLCQSSIKTKTSN